MPWKTYNMQGNYLLIKKKAFDTIYHDILIHKLERYGIRGVVLDWVKVILI